MRQCPRCGWQVGDGVQVCPTCGAALTAGGAPGEAAQPTSLTASGESPSLPGQSGALIGTWPDSPPPGFTAYPPPPTVPGYGAQPSYPTYPGYPGYPGGYAAPPGYGYPAYSPYPGYPGYPGVVPPPPAPKRRTGLIVLIVALVALLLVACGGATVLALNTASFGGAAATSAVSAANATATTQAANTALFSDSLTSNANGWSDDGTHCTFKADGYYIGANWECFAPVGTLYDATVQVQTKLTAGVMGEGFGIVLRHASAGNEYVFVTDGYGHWNFLRESNGTSKLIVPWTANDAIKSGLNSVNTLKVTMKGSQFDFYVNGTHLGSATDSTIAGGRVGLVTFGAQNVARYTNMLITQVQP